MIYTNLYRQTTRRYCQKRESTRVMRPHQKRRI